MPPPLGIARPLGPGPAPLAPPAGAPPSIMGPPPLAPPVANPAGAAQQSGPPVFGPLPPIASPSSAQPAAPIAPPSLTGAAPPSLGPLPALGSLGSTSAQGLGAQGLGAQGLGAQGLGAPPSLGPLPALGSLGAKPAAPPLGGLGPLPPVQPAAPPQGGLGPLPPLGAPPSSPAFSSSSAAIPAVGIGQQPPVGIGSLPPLGAPAQPVSSPALGPLPPLGPQPLRQSNGAMTAQPYAQPASGDPFASNGDPFASNGDPFASTPSAPQYAPPTSDSFPAADPFGSSPSSSGLAPFAQPRAQTVGPNGMMPGPAGPMRAQTIGPNGAVPLPNLGPLMPAGVAPIAPATSPQDPWSSSRIEPEIEESHTRVVAAIGSPRPKFLVTQLDGTEEGEFPLSEGENLIGREVGGMFAKDNLLSGRHATIIVQGQSVWVRDEGSRNGVYARIPRQQHVELNDGDQFCIGRIILRFEFRPAPDSVGLLHLVVGRDVDKGMFPCPVPRTGITLGRNRADLRFPLDGWVSGLHCQIVPHGPQVMIVDLGSSNGTYLRIRGVRPIAHHDALLMGQRIFHLHFQ